MSTPSDPAAIALVEDATLDFAIGENAESIAKLNRALEIDPTCFEAWLAMAEVYFADRKLDAALSSAENARMIRPGDIHANTSLSRIWMEKGDKAKAEHFGAQARMLNWKDELKNPAASGDASKSELG